jgi:small nuclear ribonucleoprotein (snRNP)-like protein
MITTEQKQPAKEKVETGPRNYSNPEPLNTSHIGKSVTVTLINGRIESGKLKALGAYMLSIEGSNGRELIINKGQIVTVSIL